MGLLVNPTSPAARALSGGLEAAARNLGLQLDVLHASTERDIDDAFHVLVELECLRVVFEDSCPNGTKASKPLAARARVNAHARETDTQFMEQLRNFRPLRPRGEE